MVTEQDLNDAPALPTTPALRILALDCGTTTGHAANTPLGIESGIRNFEVKRGESPGMRFLRFRQWLTNKVQELQPNLVIYERPEQFRSGAAVEVCVGMATRVQEVAAEYGIDYTHCNTKLLKKWATGNGNADKEQMIAEASLRYKVALSYLSRTGGDNEADALHLLAWGVAGMPVPPSAKEIKQQRQDARKTALEARQQAREVERERKARERREEEANRTETRSANSWLEYALSGRGSRYGHCRKKLLAAIEPAEDCGTPISITFTPGEWARLNGDTK